MWIFFKRGFTRAVLNSEGNIPVNKLSLTICVRAGSRTSRHSTNNGVGIGSSGQVVGLELSMMVLRSVSEMG